MGFKGNVESFSLADVFQNLAMNSQTGTLRITPERNPHAEEKYVYFQDGAVRFLSGSSRTPVLPPEVFVARGLLSKSEFDAALLRQAETTDTLVTCLSGMGYVNEQQVQDLLIHQIEEEIYDLFGWETASFEFNEGPPPEGLFAAEAAETGWGISIPVTHLIMEAARRVDEWERLRTVIPSHKEIFVVDLTVRKAIERGEMETDPVERRVAMLIDGARDVDDIAEDSKLFKFEVIGALSGFLQSSIIRPATLNELNFSEGECARNDQSKRRIKVLERILALGGENLRIRGELADLMAKMGQVEHACIHYSILGMAEIKEGHEESAIDIYKRILTIAPTNIRTREALAALYAKRSQKRDAFMQYQELFEHLRDQHQLREARDAAIHALENDPSSAKMRNALVELLLMEDKHDEASAQLELLGDFAARSRNTSFAAESYRRAMQYRKNIRPLKKKLNEVLLTKEDRVARRRRASLSALFFVVMLLAAGSIYYIESENQKKYNAAQSRVDQAMADSEKAEKEGKLEEARAPILTSIQSLSDVRKVWSPFKGIKALADNLFGALKRREELLNTKITRSQESANNTRLDMRNDAKTCFDNFDYKGAKDKYEQLIKNLDKSEEELKADKAELDKINKILDEYQEKRAKIEKLSADPSKVVKDAAEEMRLVTEFIKRYSGSKPSDFPKSLSLPLLVTPVGVDDIEVILNGNPIRTIKANAPWQDRVLRYQVYPVRSSVVYRFSKNGYTTQTEDVTLHADPASVEVKVSLERKAAVNTTFNGIQFEGDARFYNGMLYAGTSEGALLEIDVKTDPPSISARYDLEQPQAGVEKKVYGPISMFKVAGSKAPLFVYSTKGGYCVGVTKDGAKFINAWNKPAVRVLDAGQTGLDFPPAYFEQAGKPKIGLVAGSRIVIVDAETGTMAPLAMEMPINTFNNKRVEATSGPCFVDRSGVDRDGDVLLVAGSDSNIHAFQLTSLGGKPKISVWNTDLSKDAVVVNTAPVVVGDRVIVAGNNGSLRFFKLNGNRESAAKEAAGGISNPPLVVGNRAYFVCYGTTRKEGLSVIEINGPDITIKSRNDVPILLAPAILQKRLYFVTAPPNVSIYANDAQDINVVYWKHKIGRAIACPPIASESRIYVLTKDGGLIGYDEPR
ncbi:MAG: DUF4388 domain-containing protein [Planctomycetota bacterium]